MDSAMSVGAPWVSNAAPLRNTPVPNAPRQKHGQCPCVMFVLTRP